MGRLFLIAARNLRQHTWRTGLLGLAIVGVTMLLVLLSSITNGIEHTMLRAATTLSTGHVNVAGFFKVTTGQAAPVVTGYKDLREIVNREVPEAALVVDRVRGWGKVVSIHNSLQLGIGGVEIEEETAFHDVLQITSGSLDDLAKPETALLFETQAEKLEVAVGDVITISTPTVRGVQNSRDVTVVAIAKDIGLLSSFSFFVPKDTLREIYLLDERSTGAIQIYLQDPDDAEKVAERLRKAIDEAGYRTMDPQSGAFWMKFPIVTREDWTGQKIDVTTWKDELEFVTYIITTFRALTVVLMLVLLVIIVGGVMNSLWMAIRERTQEIGTLRAIGMGRRGVGTMFVLEAAILSAASTTIGALAGWGLTAALHAANLPVAEGIQLFLMRDTLALVVDPAWVVLGVVIITFFVTLFALFPAWKAAKLSPRAAMQHAG